jgi:hypothetical protein
MSKEDLKTELIQEVGDASAEESKRQMGQELRPPVFYRCRCPECGEDSLDAIESGFFTRSHILCVTSYGDVGCDYTEFTGDSTFGISCRNCGYEVCGPFSSQKGEDEYLPSNRKARTGLIFVCAKCGSQELRKIEVGIEYSNRVVAVCESDTPDDAPLVAVSHVVGIDGGDSYRYRCSQGHELAKNDGSPVETDEELIAWLKARSSSEEC